MNSRLAAIVGAALITLFPTVLYSPALSEIATASNLTFSAWLATFPVGFALACWGCSPRC